MEMVKHQELFVVSPKGDLGGEIDIHRPSAAFKTLEDAREYARNCTDRLGPALGVFDIVIFEIRGEAEEIRFAAEG
jgi:hypothetical protein